MSDSAVRRAVHARGLALALLLAAGCENPVQLEPDEHHEPVAVRIYSEDRSDLLTQSSGVGDEAEWTSALTLTTGTVEKIEIWFLAADGDVFSVAGEAEHRVEMSFEPDGIVSVNDHGTHAELAALTAGTTTATLLLYHGDHPDFRAGNLTIVVVP